MLTREGARLQVFLELRRRYGLRRGPEELVIVDDQVIERPWGWIFPWTTRGWLNGDWKYAVGGNGPCYIRRLDGAMGFFPACMTIDESISRYEASLSVSPDESA
jgi:Immunity protein 35